MQPVIDSLPSKWEVVIWNNGERMVTRSDGWAEVCDDLSVYGRYAAIEHATSDLIYVQDDDVIVSDPQKIVNEWNRWYERTRQSRIVEEEEDWFVVANMPQEFRHDGYTDSCLVGFGSCCHRDVPARAFGKFFGTDTGYLITRDQMHFNRCCDVVFTALTPRVLVNVTKTDREMASDPNRMWKQPGHLEERTRMLRLARKVRDA